MIKHTLEQHTNSLAQYLPNGRTFAAKNINDSEFRKLLKGLASELFTAEGYLCTLEQEYFPDETVLFLSEWESALGIPDGCFSGSGTLNERRRDIIVKLAATGIQTAEDFEELAALFGITVTVTSGSDIGLFPLEFPFLFVGSTRQARYTIFVTFTVPAANRFPYTFPIVFGGSEIAILECLFNHLKPINCRVVFEAE